MPAPGWTPPPSANAGEGDCMRRALACVVGVHPDEIDWIRPRSGVPFWPLYRAEAKRLGWYMRIRNFEATGGIRWGDVAKPSGLWIGVVRGRGGRTTHAVVFDGDKFHFGEQHRRRHPNKLYKIIELHELSMCDKNHIRSPDHLIA